MGLIGRGLYRGFVVVAVIIVVVIVFAVLFMRVHFCRSLLQRIFFRKTCHDCGDEAVYEPIQRKQQPPVSGPAGVQVTVSGSGKVVMNLKKLTDLEWENRKIRLK